MRALLLRLFSPFAAIDPRKLLALVGLITLVWVIVLFVRHENVKRSAIRESYALTYVKIGLARARYNDDSTALTRKFDSIAAETGITPHQLEEYATGLVNDGEELTAFWNDAQRLADSLGKQELRSMRRHGAKAIQATK